MIKYWRLLSAIIFSFAAGFAVTEPCDGPHTLRYGTLSAPSLKAYRQNIDSSLADLIRTTAPLPVELVAYDSPQQLVIAARTGEIDVTRLKLMEYLQARKVEGAIEAFAAMDFNRYVGEATQYSSILITHINSGYNTVAALKGKSLALVNLSSASGYKIPNTLFTHVINSPLEDFFSKLVLAGSHFAAMEAVLSGRVDAAFVASTALDNAPGYVVGDPSYLTVLWASPPLKAGPLVYRAALCDELKSRIRKAIFSINNPATASSLKNEAAFVQMMPVSDRDYEAVMNVMEMPLP